MPPPPGRRKALAELPAHLPSGQREFATALRSLYEETGLSLSELEARLPVSRSTLSRYLRGEGLPDVAVLRLWCELHPAGRERGDAVLGELTALLGRAASPGPAATPAEPRPQPGEPGPRTRFRRLAVVPLVVGVAAAIAIGFWITGPENAETPRRPVTVHNVVQSCQHKDTRPADCSLGLAKDPYLPYSADNRGARVWDDQRLSADCRITDGVVVTDEKGRHSSIWYRVDHAGKRLWLPGIRILPRELGKPGGLPLCTR
ncbi:helix-turn-helix transcriptional regulator [Streptomyces sp. A7024]|uniref:Helix-turn-helix transcriptional regulator n=1 Tax=Streptomyces coryli TaxID=1128680 RepID=A0A6G4TUN0_9ACTN|nr:helix-turn-helix transcriptional regulator [Streptomyces coryli]